MGDPTGAFSYREVDGSDSLSGCQRSNFRRDAKLNKERAVCCIETGEKFSSIAEAARAKGCTAANISKALRKKGFAAGGHWRSVVPDHMDEMTVRKARGLVCLACCDRGPMADDSTVKWCATCPVMRIRLYQRDDASQ